MFKKVLKDNILVKLFPETEDVIVGGIILPQKQDSKHVSQRMGVVQALGEYNIENERRIPFSVKEGDVVVLEKTAGIEHKHNSDKYVIVTESDILLILNNKESKK
jgi:chaperonin GroES